MKLAIENAHPRDQFISFDEGPHIYTVKGERGYTSVTTWNHEHFSKFDGEKIINGILKSPKMSDPNYKYYGMTREDINRSWDLNRDTASQAGTKTHYNVECFYNDIQVNDDSIEYEYFMRFVADHPHLKAYRTEWCVFYEEVKISGSIDMVFQDTRTGEFMIYDWKRSKGIEYESFGRKTAITPCIQHLPDSNFWHYSLQLNVYRKILQDKYDMKITKLALVVLHPDNQSKTYEVVDVPMMDKEMEDLWEYRMHELETK
jgi:hypothetical protein